MQWVIISVTTSKMYNVEWMTMPAMLACSGYFVCRHIGIWISLGGCHSTATAVGMYIRTTCETFSVTAFAQMCARLVPRLRSSRCALHMALMQLQTLRHRMQLSLWQPCSLSNHTTRALPLAKTKLAQPSTSTFACNWTLHEQHIAYAMMKLYACTFKEQQSVGHCTQGTLHDLCYNVLHRC